MKKIILIGMGGFIGAVLRYIVSGFALKISPYKNFPIGTLIVNILGCFLIGLLASIAEYKNIITPQLKLILMVGFLGGFTTFSTFGYESLNLFKNTANIAFFLNIFLHLFLGITAVWAGNLIFKTI